MREQCDCGERRGSDTTLATRWRTGIKLFGLNFRTGVVQIPQCHEVEDRHLQAKERYAGEAALPTSTALRQTISQYLAGPMLHVTLIERNRRIPLRRLQLHAAYLQASHSSRNSAYLGGTKPQSKFPFPTAQRHTTNKLCAYRPAERMTSVARPS